MIEFTGERLVPGQVDQDLFNEHIARYAFASRLARNKRVLDIACGTGYGTALLAEVAESAIGIDISHDAVEAAADAYPKPNLRFITAPAQEIPLDDHSFDLVVAFEVIEHLSDWRALLAEAKRLLAPGGQFIISTPNKSYYAETRKQAGPNPFHVHEFEYAEFNSELADFFPSVKLFLQNHVEAIAFHPAAAGNSLTAQLADGHAAPSPESSHFFLAVCALAAQTGAPVYLYLPSSSNVLRERELHIEKLEQELSKKDAWLDQLKLEHDELHTAHQQLQTESAKHAKWAIAAEQQLQNAQQRIVQLQEEIETHKSEGLQMAQAYEAKLRELEMDLAERTDHSLKTEQRLEAELSAKTTELAECVTLLDRAESTVVERTEWALQLQSRVEALQHLLQLAQTSRWIRLGRKIGVGPDLQNQ